jgi:ribosomal protein S18 acetylase RimI-like enzyme
MHKYMELAIAGALCLEYHLRKLRTPYQREAIRAIIFLPVPQHRVRERNASNVVEGSVVIRPMKPEDYEEVHALWMTIQGFGIRSIDDSKEDVLRFIERNPTTSVVAEYEGRIVGSILCGSDGRQGSLYHVCVAKPMRRLGIGTQMVGYCMKKLRDLSINKVTLVAFTNNDVGNAFWKQIGWKKRTDFNYYEFILNEKNITRFIGSDPVGAAVQQQ